MSIFGDITPETGQSTLGRNIDSWNAKLDDYYFFDLNYSLEMTYLDLSSSEQ